jgi:hypothetical protein
MSVVSTNNSFRRYERLKNEAYQVNLASQQREQLKKMGEASKPGDHIAGCGKRTLEDNDGSIVLEDEQILGESWKHQVVHSCREEASLDDPDQAMWESLDL